MRVRIIDLETCGFAPPAEICEVAFIDLNEDGAELARFETLARPFGVIPPEARAVHHISEEDVAGAPRFNQVMFHIRLKFPAPDVLIAHNAAFEQQWLEFENIPWVCTWKAALRIWPEAPRHSVSVLRYWLNLNVPNDSLMPAHRAMMDCAVTAEIIRSLLEHVTIDEMIVWEREPAMMPRITFGKHRGTPWADVPADYLLWILEKQDFNADVVFCVERELARRVNSLAVVTAC